jgi:AraC-like DNA-binding protein
MASSGKTISPAPSGLWTETDERSPGVVAQGVRSGEEDSRPWLAGFPVVPPLHAVGIAHAGVITAPAPYRIVRTRLSGAYFIASLSGAGRVYLNGRWNRCAAGQAVLLMPGVLNAFYTPPGGTWRYCWVRFASGAHALPGPSDRMQVITAWNAEPLSHALMGLRAEAMGGRDPALLQRWSRQVFDYVRLFHRQGEPDPRILRLWESVEKDLAAQWSIPAMIRIAAVSPEHLRRLCRIACGRGPHAHLIHLRMKRASELLLNTGWTIERIAESVGYGNAFVFSTTFKRIIGWPPSTYARRSEGR